MNCGACSEYRSESNGNKSTHPRYQAVRLIPICGPCTTMDTPTFVVPGIDIKMSMFLGYENVKSYRRGESSPTGLTGRRCSSSRLSEHDLAQSFTRTYTTNPNEFQSSTNSPPHSFVHRVSDPADDSRSQRAWTQLISHRAFRTFLLLSFERGRSCRGPG